MASRETQTNFSRKQFNTTESGDFFEKNKLVLTLVLTALSLFMLGIQLMPYVYGGSLGHFHSSGACSWPNDCSKINSFLAF